MQKTQQLGQKTYRKAMDSARVATNPLPKTLHTGALISISIGIILFLAGILGLALGKGKWGWSALGIGSVVVLVNIINLKKNES